MRKIYFLIILMSIYLCAGCSAKDNYKLSIMAPSGAPGIALADIYKTYSDDYDIELNKSVDVLSSLFASKEADVILAPINLGAIQYKANETYVLSSVVTWGNLYFASQKEDFKLEDLNQADAILFGQNTINDAIVQHVLSSKNIILGENTTYLANTQLTNQQLIQNPNAIVLVAEPALSTAKSKNTKITSISVQDLYKEISGSSSYPQAGCFIKSSTIVDHKDVVNEFLSRLETSCKKCNEQTEVIAGYAEELNLGGTKDVLVNAIPNSNISFIRASKAKADVEKVYSLNPKLFGGEKPKDEFYYA